jgi:hypothetical protein
MLLTRPNLAPLGVVLAGWMCWRILSDRPARRLHIRRAAIVATGLTIGAVSVARLHRFLGVGIAAAMLVLAVQGWHDAGHWRRLWIGEALLLEMISRVRTSTPEQSVILSAHYSGTVWYHGGRACLRWDGLPDDWLDRAVGWLAERGVRTYAMVDSWELRFIRPKFAGQRLGKVFDAPPVMRAGDVAFFDLGAPPGTSTETISYDGRENRCEPRVPKPALIWKQ